MVQPTDGRLSAEGLPTWPVLSVGPCSQGKQLGLVSGCTLLALVIGLADANGPIWSDDGQLDAYNRTGDLLSVVPRLRRALNPEAGGSNPPADIRTPPIAKFSGVSLLFQNYD